MLAGIARDGRIVLGGDISVAQQFRNLDQEQIEALLDYSTEMIGFVETRTLFRTADATKSILVSLKAVDARYPVYGDLRIHQKLGISDLVDTQSGRFGVFVDQSIIESGNAKIGEIISMGDQQYEVIGVIENEPDRIGSSAQFAFWPRVMVHLDSLERSGLLSEGSRNFYEYRLKLKDHINVDQVVDEIDERYPYLSVRSFQNASPDLTDVVNRLNVLLSLAGLTTLLVGGVGVSNALRAYLDTRLSTIAILKNVGGSNRFIFLVYLTQILVLSFIGIALGLFSGYGFAFAAASGVEQMLSIPVALTLRPDLVAVIVTYGVLTTLLFTLWPLGRALNTSPSALFRDVVSNERQSASWQFAAVSFVIAVVLAVVVIATAYQKNFAVWFVVGVSVAWLAFKLIGEAIIRAAKKVGLRKSSVVRLAVSNLHRPGSTTSDIVLAVGLGLSVLIATALTSANLDRQINGLITKEAPSLFFVGIESAQLEEFKDMVNDALGVSEFNIMPYIPGRIIEFKGMDPEDALVEESGRWMIDDDGERTVSYTSEPLKDVQMVAGKWWSADYRGPTLASIHEDVADSFDLDIGDSMVLNILGRDVHAEVANIRDLEWRTMRLNFAITLSPYPLNTIPHTSVATVHVAEGLEYVLQDQVASTFANITVVRVKDALNRVNELLVRGKNAARIVGLITVIAGVLVLAGIVISENRRRAFETVLLKTVGAPRKFVLTVFSLEYLLQGSITAFVAVVVGSVTSWAVVSELMGWDWQFIAPPAFYTAILGVVISLLLGMAGVWRALQHRPLYYLRNG